MVIAKITARAAANIAKKTVESQKETRWVRQHKERLKNKSLIEKNRSNSREIARKRAARSNRPFITTSRKLGSSRRGFVHTKNKGQPVGKTTSFRSSKLNLAEKQYRDKKIEHESPVFKTQTVINWQRHYKFDDALGFQHSKPPLRDINDTPSFGHLPPQGFSTVNPRGPWNPGPVSASAAESRWLNKDIIPITELGRSSKGPTHYTSQPNELVGYGLNPYPGISTERRISQLNSKRNLYRERGKSVSEIIAWNAKRKETSQADNELIAYLKKWDKKKNIPDKMKMKYALQDQLSNQLNPLTDMRGRPLFYDKRGTVYSITKPTINKVKPKPKRKKKRLTREQREANSSDRWNI